MAIVSMTGFARCQSRQNAHDLQVEARCVNGRSADIKLRLPSGLEDLDKPVRDIFAQVIRRGNANITLSLQRDSQRQPRINIQALTLLRSQLGEQADSWGEPHPQLADLLRLPGIVEMSEPAVQMALEEQGIGPAILALAAQCADELARSRAGEGAALQGELGLLIEAMDQTMRDLAAMPQARGEHLAARLKAQLDRLLGDAGTLDPVRLHQEVALLASKADIEEELARLRAHFQSARAMMRVDEPVGRKLDFLAQEMNREANTICSKASAIEVTQAGLALKALVDQFKEQVQNVE